ncbi:uncharacterized protein LOC117813771 isoform X1 [Xyrichtys novacula]|uniref:Uncharacterized protein LOC117813771 isoform X1 n=1 Tax=Xyrichtys novacula TaxID=13765 RepID=A0AAV1F992_XYRNO|nr:uncharacterized protein LOC117813771 isoform X1 [Xyrichtys novacula]
MDSFWESLILSGKRKKKSKKNRGSPKCKKSSTRKGDKLTQERKKKKSSRFKEAMKENKEKKKQKEDRESRLAFKPDDSFVVTQGSNGQSKAAMKHETFPPLSSDKLNSDLPTGNSKKKDRKKRKVAFDLSSGHIRAKHPEPVSLTQQSPKESLLSKNKRVRERESCSQVTVTEHSHGQTYNNDSQCTSDDINSQDLFITQKKFRVPAYGDASGDEAIDKIIKTAVGQMEQCHEEDTHFFVQGRETTEHAQGPDTVQGLPKEEKEDRELRGESSVFQSQMWIHTNHAEGKKEPCPIYTKARVVSPCLDEPVVVPLSQVAPKLETNPLSSTQQSSLCLQPLAPPKMTMSSTSTQTENFFTTELSSFFKFRQRIREAVLLEDLEPLDLSLQNRTRKDLGTYLSVETSSVSREAKDYNHKNLHPSCLSDMEVVEVMKEPTGQYVSMSAQSESERAVTSLSESDKSADTTTSSEDGEQSCRISKQDLAQVRAVQMRLNESFFFKTKGEGCSPRPASPLMKLAQSRKEVKSKRSR